MGTHSKAENCGSNIHGKSSLIYHFHLTALLRDLRPPSAALRSGSTMSTLLSYMYGPSLPATIFGLVHPPVHGLHSQQTGCPLNFNPGCCQIGAVRCCFASRKKTGGTGWKDWTRCLQIRKQLVARYGQVQTIIFGLGLYASLIGIVIGVFSNFRHSRLKPFRHEGNPRYRPVSVSKQLNFR